jgi:membrane associated rhomboid family serine protease
MEEYLDASNNMRHYGNMRFALLTLFSALTAGVITVLFKDGNPVSGLYTTALKLIGFVVTVAFFIMELRATEMFNHYCTRAKELDQMLGSTQHITRPDAGLLGVRILSAQYATNVLYISVAAFWLYALFN